MTKRRHPPQPVPGTASASEAFFAFYESAPPEIRMFTRRLATAREFALWKECPRDECRRAKACRGDDAACVDEQRAPLIQKMMQTFALWAEVAAITPDEFELFWEQQAREAGVEKEEDDGTGSAAPPAGSRPSPG